MRLSVGFTAHDWNVGIIDEMSTCCIREKNSALVFREDVRAGELGPQEN
jgi:hypothetical protein